MDDTPCLYDDILHHASEQPLATAVVETDEQGNVHRYTFGELRDFALGIRHALLSLARAKAKGTRNIGILAGGGSLSLCAAWIAVMWEGYTVVPLSTVAPAVRLAAILADADVTVVIVTDEESYRARDKIYSVAHPTAVLDVRGLRGYMEGQTNLRDVSGDPQGIAPTVASDDAYIFYTSGSSGEPKGVHSSHEPMMNRLRWMWQRWPLAPDDVCCQRVDHVFIDFVAELFGPLCRGVALVVVPSIVRRDPTLLRDFIRRHGVTRITLVPTLARLLVAASGGDAASSPLTDSVPPIAEISSTITDGATIAREGVTPKTYFASIRMWILSGEALPWSVARNLARLSTDEVLVLNLYGSTEVAADVMYYCWDVRGNERMYTAAENQWKEWERRGDCSSVPIGQPIPGCRVELMELSGDDSDSAAEGRPPSTLRRISPMDRGRVGKLYISGRGLATGYWGRPETTTTRFPWYTWNATDACYSICREPAELAEGERGKKAIRFFNSGDLASYEGKFRTDHAVGDGGEEGWGVVYHGRLDQQIKVHGRRLDLGEIDMCLMKVEGIQSAATVDLSSVDTRGKNPLDGSRNMYGSESSAGDVIGALVSPEGVDQSAIMAVCRQHLPHYALPWLISTVETMPTLPGSGKIDRRQVRQILADLLNNGDRGICVNSESDTSLSMTNTFSSGSSYDTNVVANLIMGVARNILEGDLSPAATATRSTGTNISGKSMDVDSRFTDTGLSSIQAVQLLGELHQHVLPLFSELNSSSRLIGLVDLYEFPSARLLAERMVTLAFPMVTTSSTEATAKSETTKPHNSAGLDSQAHRQWRHASRNETVIAKKYDCIIGQEPVAVNGVTITPLTSDNLAETCAHVSATFLSSEPLLAARYARCRATAGPLAGAVVRKCYAMVVRRNITSLRRIGARILVATSDETGRVVGFTIGTEIVKSSLGRGFLRSASTVDQIFRAPGEHEHQDPGKQGTRQNVGYRGDGQRAKSSLQLCANMLLQLPLRPILRPCSAVVGELLDRYQHARGWAYAPGEIMYISETGYRERQRNKSDGQHGEDSGHDVGDGIRGVATAAALEQHLLKDAADVGFIRAITICTSMVTAHIARELGFREISRISSIQTYHPLRGGLGTSRSRAQPWQEPAVQSRHGRRRPVGGCDILNGSRSGEQHDAKEVRVPGPFADVSIDHEAVVLFEKILAPRVHPELLLARAEVERKSPSTYSGNDCSAGIASNPVFARHDWKLVPLQTGDWRNRFEALGILGDSLPGLAASGRAVEYMADGVNGQKAFVLLASMRKLSDTDAAFGLYAPDSIWNVVACMSWCHSTRPTSGENSGGGIVESVLTRSTAFSVDVSSTSSRTGTRSVASDAAVQPHWHELLVLAVHRRWRYRGIGTAMMRRMLSDSRQAGCHRVYVRSLQDSVEFYESLGFTRPEGRKKQECIPSLPGEDVLVYELD